MTLTILLMTGIAQVGSSASPSQSGVNWLAIIGIVSFVLSVLAAGPVLWGTAIVFKDRRRRMAAGFDRKSELRVDVIRSNERDGLVFPNEGSRPGERGQWGTLHPRGVRVPRPTTGIGQAVGALASGRFVGALYSKKPVGVFVSPEDMDIQPGAPRSSRPSASFRFYFADSEHIIIGGIERNSAAVRFAEELQAHFGSDVILWRTDQAEDASENTVDIGIPWITRAKRGIFSRRSAYSLSEYEIINGLLGPANYPPSADYGLVVFWRNPDQEDRFQRIVLCVGGSSYGTGDCVRFVFDNLLLGSVGSKLRLVRTSSQIIRSILSALRRHSNCVFILLAFEYGDLRQLAEPWTGSAKTARVVAFAVLDEEKDRQAFNERPDAPRGISSVSVG
jgi:hypothetical protein